MYKIYLCIALLLLVFCTDKQDDFKSPPGYNLGKPEKFVMPDALNEISGIGYHNDSLYAVQDEEGKLYLLHPGDKKAGVVKFGKRGDYEDLAIARGQVIILRSDGTLYSFPFAETRKEEITTTKEWKDLVPKGEYEGLYADEYNGLVYVLCKQCKQDKKNDATGISILQLQPDGSITQSGNASVGVKSRNFHPSALTKNPQTQEWYILSSANKMLVIADNSWNVKAEYPLDPALFRQPEGIVFDRENNLYISNEGDAISNGNVLKFVYNKTN